jgi:nitroimidazol reductase NimA-like FMN-containing flavoprotein (pyridoxamine 5'-phosphate oxidase superfamily)
MANSSFPSPERPAMPESYGLNADGVTFTPIAWEWVTARLEKSRNYWVATTRKNGRPHVSPVWGLWFEGRIHFATDAKSLKAQNLDRDRSCSVHLESGDEVVILDGRAERIEDESALERFLDAYDRKYSIRPEIGPGSAPIFAVTHTTVIAWTESDFPNTATRWKFR